MTLEEQLLEMEERVTKLEKRYKALANSVKQQQKNQTAVTGEVDSSANMVDALTPYTEIKSAYVGDTELAFDNVPDGNLSVYVKDADGNYPNYTVERIWDKVTVYFDPLEYVTTVTISVVG